MSSRVETTSLYRTLADALRTAIVSGTLKSGEKLQSLRQVSIQQKISLSTAIQAYRLLEEQGLIEARPQAGYFVMALDKQLQEPQLTQPSPNPTKVGINELSADILAAAANPERIPLGAACPSPELFPAQAIRRALGRILRQRPYLIAEYESPRVLRRLQILREWSHEQNKQIFPRSQGTRSSYGAGTPQ